MTHTYTTRTMANYRDGYVIIPDAVADDQRAYDGKVILCMRCDITGRILSRRMISLYLRGDLYDLWGSGTGDIEVDNHPIQ